MTQLSTEQINSIATTVQSALIADSDSYINRAIEAQGVDPGEVNDDQYNEILDRIFR
jgi:hypothetical protein